MRNRIAKAFTCVLFALCVTASLAAAELSFDQATGKLVGFELSVADSKVNPSDYTNKVNEYWESPYQYIGRLNYIGPETTITFANSGSNAIGTTNSRFYFTYLTDGVSRLDQWREFFLVARVKGLFQGGGQDDFVGRSTAISQNGGTVSIPVDSGSQEVAVGQQGYNDTGGRAKRTNSSSQYKYLYKYKYIWVDLTVIRTNVIKPTPLPLGFYETQFSATASTTPSCSYNFLLVGENNPNGASNFLFNVINVAPSPFPFTDMQTKNTIQNSLKVGELTYYSSLNAAKLEFSSSPNGNAINFTLTSGAFSFPYKVGFDCNKPALAPTPIDTTSVRFNSVYTSSISPIDGTTTNKANVIEGDLMIYVNPNTLPMSGKYTSTIYCILTQTN